MSRGNVAASPAWVLGNVSRCMTFPSYRYAAPVSCPAGNQRSSGCSFHSLFDGSAMFSVVNARPSNLLKPFDVMSMMSPVGACC